MSEPLDDAVITSTPTSDAATSIAANKRDDLPPRDTTAMTSSSICGLNPLSVARVIIGFFSTIDVQRESPSSKKTTHLRLITIGISPFCEKVRWGLDLLEQSLDNPYYYTEDAHPPAFHGFYTLPITNGTISRTPIVVFPDGSYRSQSHQILAELCPFLYPSEIAREIREFELDIATRLGAPIRALCYYYLLDDERKYYNTYCKVTCQTTSKVEAILFEKMLDKGIDKALKETLQWNDDNYKTCIKEVKLVLEEISERLSCNGGEYIFDTPEKKYGFTAADLALAALASPMIRPPQFSNYAVQDNDSPTEFIQLIKSFNETKAGQHCCKTYKLHRPVQKDGKVHFKTVARNKNPFQEPAFLYSLGASGLAVLTAATAIFWMRSRS